MADHDIFFQMKNLKVIPVLGDGTPATIVITGGNSVNGEEFILTIKNPSIVTLEEIYETFDIHHKRLEARIVLGGYHLTLKGV